MLASKPWTTAVNVLLIAIIVFNALIPTTAIAMSLPKEDEVASVPVQFASVWGTTGFTARVSDSLNSSNA